MSEWVDDEVGRTGTDHRNYRGKSNWYEKARQLNALWREGRRGGGGLGGGGRLRKNAWVVRMGSLYQEGLRKEIS